MKKGLFKLFILFTTVICFFIISGCNNLNSKTDDSLVENHMNTPEDGRKFTIYWIDGDGSIIKEDKDVQYGTMPEYTGPTPTKKRDKQYAYSFNGWSPSLEKVTENTTYIAQFTKEVAKYTIRWENFDGSLLYESEYEYGNMPEYTGETPTRKKSSLCTYTFSQWTPEISSVTCDMTYTATYETNINQYTISFVDDDGSLLYSTTLGFGKIPEYKGPTPTKQQDKQYTYSFAGWSPSQGAVTKDTTYKAQYTKEVTKYTIRWEDEDGTLLYSTLLSYGTDISKITENNVNTTKENDDEYSYTFKGWNPSLGKVTKDQVYVAEYDRTELPYTFIFNLNGGESESGVVNKKTNRLSKEDFKFDLHKGDKQFRGWMYNGKIIFDAQGNLKNRISQLLECMTFDALYEGECRLTISYLYNGGFASDAVYTLPEKIGQTTSSGSYSNHTNVALFAIASDGYKFDGWYKQSTRLSKDANYTIGLSESDITITARFSKKTFTFRASTNNTDLGKVQIEGGLVTNSISTDITYESRVIVYAVTQGEEDFLGWYDSDNNLVSKETKYMFNMPSYNFTLTAKWNKFTIKYDLDGGQNNEGNPLYYRIEDDNIKLLDPVKDNYDFIGWETANGPITEINTKEAKNIVVYAKWEIKQYSITIINELDNISISGITSGEKYPCFSYVTLKATGMKSGYTIKWSRDDEVSESYMGATYTFYVLSHDITITISTQKPYTINGSKAYFGRYPQSLVVDSTILDNLNKYIGSLPTADNTNGWVDYHYYLDGKEASYMFYKDIDIDKNGTKDYRGVYFTSYRPYNYIDQSFYYEQEFQKKNGYEVNTIYWFKFEIIEWNIIDNESYFDKDLLIANLNLDAQEYYPSTNDSKFTHNSGYGYANNYAYSNIRKWLNNSFYSTAFSTIEKTVIPTMSIDNSATTTANTPNLCACANTSDKIFLLSFFEAEQKKSLTGVGGISDYAKCQGISTFTYNEKEAAYSWLRSPDESPNMAAVYLIGDGSLNYNSVECSAMGIRPALWLTL